MIGKMKKCSREFTTERRPQFYYHPKIKVMLVFRVTRRVCLMERMMKIRTHWNLRKL